jgi:hypothetical protein
MMPMTLTSNMCRPSKPLVRHKSRGRSAVTNGKQLHANAVPVDGRSHRARRFRYLVAAFTAERASASCPNPSPAWSGRRRP